ncbi:hypothetical protein LEP1GSC047_0754 [Leptospira inadai serovar Lyme str. 10]|uniref:Uncharacterized protein n=2 Tax=Leptospira inadai serovar Lyme TaxID=293084 RepID=V6HVY4_9LEPT|nr:hypothetical protein LEP1GSC047_0754 [Leptospira inadai serovar Lyme str. 10]PNV76620.1 hypothetical protein BES34_003295 [Leptospira inadai serovar Lyme]
MQDGKLRGRIAVCRNFYTLDDPIPAGIMIRNSIRNSRSCKTENCAWRIAICRNFYTRDDPIPIHSNL